MPYIDEAERDALGLVHEEHALTPGELNYQITQLLDEYVRTHGKSYATLNDVLGAVEGAKLEFYRRVAAPYEDVKARLNGDVYSATTLEVPRG